MNSVITAIESKDDVSPKLAQFLGSICTVLFVVVGLYIAMQMLSWAMNLRATSDQTANVSSDVTTQKRERQLACLAKNIYHEAGNQPFEGKVAVAQVTLNRAASGRFPDDICQTIYQKNVMYEKVICQFSWVCDREVLSRPINKANFRESEEVAKKVLLEGFRLPSLEKAMYFHADYIDPKWKRERIVKIGNHIFYR